MSERNPAVRLPPSTAFAVLAVTAGICAVAVLGFLLGELRDALGAVAIAAIIGGVLGMLIVPRVLCTNALAAMFIGVLVALLSYIPFSILWLLASTMSDTAFVFSEFAQAIALVLAYGYILGGIPLIIFGAIAGFICSLQGVSFEEQG